MAAPSPNEEILEPRAADLRSAPSPVGLPERPLPASRAARRHRSPGTTCRARCSSSARRSIARPGPKSCAFIGETEFVNGVAAMAASGRYGPVLACEGIVVARRPDAGRGGRPGARRAHPRRQRPLPRHPPRRRLGRRARTSARATPIRRRALWLPTFRAGLKELAKRNLSLRGLAVSPAAART